MTRPGVVISARASATPHGPPTSTGVWFVAGLTDRGPVDVAGHVRSFDEFTAAYGARVAYSSLADAVETFFKEGGAEAYVARIVGGAAVNAVHTFVDRAGAPLSTIDVKALAPGAYGNALTVAILQGTAGTDFIIQVLENGVEVERSTNLTSPTEAVAWGAASKWVRVVDKASVTVAPNNNPALIVATALTTGTDDRGAVVDATKLAAVNGLFPRSLGPGQVSIPGATTTAIYTGLLTHAQTNNRVALLDGADTANDATLNAAADAIRAASTVESFGGLFAPWHVVPGVVSGTTRTVPPSAATAGLMARSDGTNSPNVPAAGPNGVCRFVVNLSQTVLTGAVRQGLNEKGVNVYRMTYGTPRLYGYRTLVDPVNDAGWLSLAAARLRMQITNDADILGEEFMFPQLDGKGHTIARWAGALTGLLAGYYAVDALYGTTPDEAFSVDTGPTVNTPATIANGELHAVLAVRTSPFAELVSIEIVKVPLTESV